MSPQLPFDESYVAYIDILGFSDFVERAVASSDGAELSRLYKCHRLGSSIIKGDPLCSIVQFSDSIVISRPFDRKYFNSFVRIVANYQRMLLRGGFLCRGAISRGRHYSSGSFMVSAGLVDAYRVEQEHARYPRIVVSRELLGLLEADALNAAPYLVLEDDGLVFVNYLSKVRTRELKGFKRIVTDLTDSCIGSRSSSVREKGVWLAAFADRELGTNLQKKRFAEFQVVQA